MSAYRSRHIGRQAPGRPALINPDLQMMLTIDAAPDGIPRKGANPFKLSHLLTLEYAIEKDDRIKITHLGRHWLAHQ